MRWNHTGACWRANWPRAGSFTRKSPQSESLTAQKRLVEAGFGMALMPRRNVSDELTRGTLRLVEIGSVEAQLPIVLVRCRGGPQENALEAFVAKLQDRMPALFDS